MGCEVRVGDGPEPEGRPRQRNAESGHRPSRLLLRARQTEGARGANGRNYLLETNGLASAAGDPPKACTEDATVTRERKGREVPLQWKNRRGDPPRRRLPTNHLPCCHQPAVMAPVTERLIPGDLSPPEGHVYHHFPADAEGTLQAVPAGHPPRCCHGKRATTGGGAHRGRSLVRHRHPKVDRLMA